MFIVAVRKCLRSLKFISGLAANAYTGATNGGALPWVFLVPISDAAN